MTKQLSMKTQWLEIRKYFLVRLMAVIGLGTIAVSCNSSQKKTGNEENKDSVISPKPSDSIRKDTVVTIPAKDTAKKNNIKQQVKPQPTKYGVPENMPTKYGVPANFQTKYGVPGSN